VGSKGRRKSEPGALGEGSTTSFTRQPVHVEEVENDLATGVEDLHVHEGMAAEAKEDQKGQLKERVSFGTNMTTEDELPGNDSCMQEDAKLLTAVERFHARKFGARKMDGSEKWPVLKVGISSMVKKQKTPINTAVQGATRSLSQDGLHILLNEMKEEPSEKPDVKMADDAAALVVDPRTLTGSLEEARQE
jgi:hypothetical protein